MAGNVARGSSLDTRELSQRDPKSLSVSTVRPPYACCWNEEGSNSDASTRSGKGDRPSLPTIEASVGLIVADLFCDDGNCHFVERGKWEGEP